MDLRKGKLHIAQTEKKIVYKDKRNVASNFSKLQSSVLMKISLDICIL